MELVLTEINRPMNINGVEVEDIMTTLNSLTNGDNLVVRLRATKVADRPEPVAHNISETLTGFNMKVNGTYIIKVRQYMTKPSTPEFDFQTKWNNDIPMPFRIMQGIVLKETRGMLMMDCKVVPLQTDTCMRCGRTLTNPVSRLYGIGPECGNHAYINPFNTEEELYDALDEVRDTLEQITWKGWIIKSAIEECKHIESEKLT